MEKIWPNTLRGGTLQARTKYIFLNKAKTRIYCAIQGVPKKRNHYEFKLFLYSLQILWSF